MNEQMDKLINDNEQILKDNKNIKIMNEQILEDNKNTKIINEKYLKEVKKWNCNLMKL